MLMLFLRHFSIKYSRSDQITKITAKILFLMESQIRYHTINCLLVMEPVLPSPGASSFVLEGNGIERISLKKQTKIKITNILTH